MFPRGHGTPPRVFYGSRHGVCNLTHRENQNNNQKLTSDKAHSLSCFVFGCVIHLFFVVVEFLEQPELAFFTSWSTKRSSL